MIETHTTREDHVCMCTLHDFGATIPCRMRMGVRVRMGMGMRVVKVVGVGVASSSSVGVVMSSVRMPMT